MPTRGDDPDWAALVAAVRNGSCEAEQAMVKRLYPRISGHIQTWRARRETVEDLAQEVFLRVFTRLPQFRDGSFTAWVDVITRRICYDALRRQRIRPEWTIAELGDNAPEPPAVPPPDPADYEAAETVAGLLARLAPAQAWLLREVELAERSIGEVSRSMGWTATAGRLRLYRARQALKSLYAELEPDA